VNEFRIVNVGFNLASKACNGMIDRSRVRHFGKSPHLAKQLIAVNDLLSALGQISQKLELPMRQVHRPKPSARDHRSEIDEDIVQSDGVNGWPRPPQDYANTCAQLLEVKWFGHVVVSTQIQPS
jgi:hypothetical protein